MKYQGKTTQEIATQEGNEEYYAGRDAWVSTLTPEQYQDWLDDKLEYLEW